ncbi:MAG: NADH-quinone oxidoreductase subunit L [Candidatus Dormibacteria bacterium]
MSTGILVSIGLLFPLLGFIAVRWVEGSNRPLVRVIGPGSIGLAFVAFAAAAIINGRSSGVHHLYQWIAAAPDPSPAVSTPGVPVGLLFDPLAAVMTLVVTGVGFLIHVYAVGYMHGEGDDDFSRFFSQMNLFVFSMLLLVLASNFVMLVVGWALVGVSSYLLIGFYQHRPAAVRAARKAFVVNVIGDVAIVIASFVAFDQVHGLGYADLFARIGVQAPPLPPAALEAMAFLLLVGAVAKSAQLPLHTWLPDAMEGPTPVSALIHAATMVTAGVYLVARFEPLFHVAPVAAATAAAIGITTALMAAVLACVQTDIKRVLAYSTMSQVGYMFFAVAAGAEVAGIFHLVTHAFFKALLFLAAGNVIHALGGEQDMRKMGGLHRGLPVSHWLFLVGVFAIAGIPPLAGYFSKDEIIRGAFVSGPLHPLGGLLLVAAAGLTAYYMFRAYYLVFLGPGDHSGVHEAPSVMLVPASALAVLAALGGFLQPGPWHLLDDFIVGRFAGAPAGATVTAAVLSIAAVAGGIAVANIYYGRADSRRPVAELAGGQGPLARAFYWDELYEHLVVAPLWALGGVLDRLFEVDVIGGGLNLATRAAVGAGQQVRRLQSGYLRSYALLFAVAALLAVVVVGAGLR